MQDEAPSATTDKGKARQETGDVEPAQTSFTDSRTRLGGICVGLGKPNLTYVPPITRVRLGRPNLPPITIVPPTPPSLLAVPAEKRTAGLLSRHIKPKQPLSPTPKIGNPKAVDNQQLLLPFTRIDTAWVPHLRSAYCSCDDFKTIASYPQLYTSVPEPKFHVTYDNDKDDSTLTIYKQDKDGSIRLYILSNCRTMLDKGVKEL